MATDLTVILQDRPGTLADMGEALGNAGINIVGTAGFPCEGKGVIHILVEDAAAARKALEEKGFEVSSDRPVLVLDIEDKPGELGDISRRIANAGVNIDLLYVTASKSLVLGVDDMDKARAAL
jgi:hypothetical protein